MKRLRRGVARDFRVWNHCASLDFAGEGEEDMVVVVGSCVGGLLLSLWSGESGMSPAADSSGMTKKGRTTEDTRAVMEKVRRAKLPLRAPTLRMWDL